MNRTPSVAIIGAGMSGICMGIKLKQAGIEDFVIYEKASHLGGTWRENQYPGLCCDVPARCYAFSFAPNPGWKALLADGREIWNYFERVCDDHGIRPHIRFGEHVQGGSFQEGRWRVRSSGEERDFDFLVSAAGFLHKPNIPAIPGLEDFAGPCFHSTRWDHSVSLADKRVGVIGTGSTGCQIIGALGGNVRHLSLFQRTPQWVLPLPNFRTSRLNRQLMARFPVLDRLVHKIYSFGLEHLLGVAAVRPCWQRTMMQAMCRLHLHRVRDPDLRKRLTPDYQPLCKRIVMGMRFYPGIQHPDSELVDTPIARVEPEGVRTTDGVLHELDVLTLATGFDGAAYGRPLDLVGTGGVTLDAAWADGPRGYLTATLPNFPNLFMLVGPHSPFGNHSVTAIAETQVAFAMEWIERFRRGELSTFVPTAEATDRFNAEMAGAMPDTVWVTGCRSWYMGDGDQPLLWPWTADVHRERLAAPPAEDFVTTP